MADIDLVKAYQDFADLMDEMGFGHEAYCIDLHVWNHRRSTVTVTFTLSAMIGAGCEQAYQAATLAEGFAAMRKRLRALKVKLEGAGTALGVVAVPVPEVVPVPASTIDDDIPF